MTMATPLFEIRESEDLVEFALHNLLQPVAPCTHEGLGIEGRAHPITSITSIISISEFLGGVPNWGGSGIRIPRIT